MAKIQVDIPDYIVRWISIKSDPATFIEDLLLRMYWYRFSGFTEAEKFLNIAESIREYKSRG